MLESSNFIKLILMIMLNRLSSLISSRLKIIHHYIKSDFKFGNNEDSVFFFTLHKSGSVLFTNEVLPYLEGLIHVDYETFLWAKDETYKRKLRFVPKGFVYGPIRLSGIAEPVKSLIINRIISTDFLNNKKGIILIRDPRDILVSQYYSFGFTHSLNPNKKLREKQKKGMTKTQNTSIDDYIVSNIDHQIENFNRIDHVLSACNNSVLLKYEDMIHNFDHFVNNLQSMVNLPDQKVKNLFQLSRPCIKIDIKSHKRSGTTRQFEKELNDITIGTLNKRLEPILLKYGYII